MLHKHSSFECRRIRRRTRSTGKKGKGALLLVVWEIQLFLSDEEFLSSLCIIIGFEAIAVGSNSERGERFSLYALLCVAVSLTTTV